MQKNRALIVVLVSVVGFACAATILLANESSVSTTAYLPFTQFPESNRYVVPNLPFDPYTHQRGEGTYYAATGGGNCSFAPTPGNLMVAAMNERDYGDSWICGAYIEVQGPQGSTIVRIVDRCPGCLPGDIDLSPQAFEQIAAIDAGRVDISWRILSPDLQSPVIYHFKEGSNQWWTAVQVRNHRNPIAKFEFHSGDGNFREVPRERYNYFVYAPGMGPGPYTFRITDIYGHTIADSNIPLRIGDEVPGRSQFPAQP